MAGISLIILLAVILIAYFKKMNPGLLGMAAAFLIGFFLIVTDKTYSISSVAGGCKAILSAFPYTLWFRIMVVAIFFAFVELNGTLELFTKKFINLIGGRTKLLPFFFYILTAFLAAIGAGSIGVLILLMPIAAAMCKEQKIDFMLTGLAVALGGAAGGLSPLAATGIVTIATATTAGIEVGTHTFMHALILITINIVVFYFVLGGYKYKNTQINKAEPLPKFTTEQMLTLLTVLVFAVFACLGYEISFLAAVGIVILSFITKVDGKKAISKAPWYTLVLLCGMSMMIGMVKQAGGITLLTDFFSSFMTGKLATFFITIVAGLMSFVSSASGVVIPTLVPTVPELSAATGAAALALVDAIALGSHATGISPFSTGGSLVLSMGGENIDQEKTFNKLIIFAFFQLALECVYSLIGIM